jgi:hypothetical protein
MFLHLIELLGVAVTLCTRIPEVLRSSLDRDTGYPDRVSVVFPSPSNKLLG